MITASLTALTALTLALCVVFALRRGLRRWCGATSAYALWMLPPVALLAVLLPSWTPVLTARLPVTRVVAGMVQVASNHVDGTHGLTALLAMLWLGGSTFSLFGMVLRHHQLHRQMQALPDTMRDALAACMTDRQLGGTRLHDAGPAVIWSGRTLLLLPTDFMSRFSHDERQLILEHEMTHIRHGDAWWNLLTELATVVFWFHPLVWFARSRIRLDQELACDDSVLLRHPGAARTYAHTLLHGTGHAGTPVLATWLEEPQLKERLTMIRNLATRAPMRRVGLPVIAALLAGCVFAAQAMGDMNDPHVAHPPHVMASSWQSTPPHYPKYASEHGLEGTVVVRVKVGTDGSPLEVLPEATKANSHFVRAAVEAVRQWRYQPATNAKGEPVVAWIKVPVKFALDNSTKKDHGPAAGKGK